MSETIIVPFRRRRSYLDECRDRGIYQEIEEIKAERQDLQTLTARLRKDSSASVRALADFGDAAARHSHQVLGDREEVLRRFKAFFEGYRAAGMGDPHFPLLEHLLFETDIAGHRAQSLFASASHDYHSNKIGNSP